MSEEHVAEALHDLRLTSDDPYAGPGPEAARARAAQRRHHQRGLAAVLVLIAALVIAGLFREDTMRLRPAEAPSPDLLSEAPYSGSGTSSEGPVQIGWWIDWANATIDLPKNDACPDERVAFRNGKGTVGPLHYRIRADGASGDVTGDGVTEAAVVIECFGTAETAGPETRYLVAVFGQPVDGTPKPLGVVYAEQAYVDPSVEIGDETIILNLRPANGGTQIQTFRWVAGRFTRVS